MLAEVRMARIVDAIGRVRDKRSSCVEAAELLGLSERHFRRLRGLHIRAGHLFVTLLPEGFSHFVTSMDDTHHLAHCVC